MKTEIVCVIDKSGSMGSIRDDAIGVMKSVAEFLGVPYKDDAVKTVENRKHFDFVSLDGLRCAYNLVKETELIIYGNLSDDWNTLNKMEV